MILYSLYLLSVAVLNSKSKNFMMLVYNRLNVQNIFGWNLIEPTKEMKMAADALENVDKEEPVGFCCEEFKEAEEVKGLIGTLPDIYNDQIAVETAVERFTGTFS